MEEPNKDSRPAEPTITNLSKALQSSDPAVLRETLPLWTEISGLLQAAVPRLVELLKTGDTDARVQLIGVLRGLGQQSQSIVETVRTALRETALVDKDQYIRENAIDALVHVGMFAAADVARLVAGLRDDLPAVRMSTAYALGERGPEARSATTALYMTLSDPDIGVRLHAAAALWKIDRRERIVLPVLIEALQDENEVIRWIAADCVGGMGPAAHRAVPALRAALLEDYKIAHVRKGILLALERIEQAQGDEPDTGETPHG